MGERFFVGMLSQGSGLRMSGALRHAITALAAQPHCCFPTKFVGLREDKEAGGLTREPDSETRL
jgi:hypothetical protein